ncbi:MAG: thiamine pyrophosphate-binding protein [Anaerolineae bacterium]
MARTVADVLVQQMADWGIRFAFGVMGETILALADAIRRQEQVRFVATQHEEAAAFAASAYAKLTGQPAACIATGGPGATALMTGIYDAAGDGAPVLALTGQVRTGLAHVGAHQEIDTHALFAPVAVYNAQVGAPAQAPTLLAAALRAARSRRGVAHLSLPADVQEMGAETGPVPPRGRYEPEPPVAAEAALRQAARMLNGAVRPLLLAGAGARGAREPLLTLAYRLGAPVLTTCRSKGLIPAEEPLAGGTPGLFGTPVADDLLREADTILAVGCSLSESTSGGWQLLRPDQNLLQMDLDPGQIGRLYPAAVGLWGDASASLERLMALLPQCEVREPWADVPARRRELQGLLEAKAREPASPIKPQFLVRALQQALPEDSILALDTGDHAFFVCQQYGVRRETVLMSYHLASTGFALPAAMAAALAHPERQAVAVVGDGGLTYSLGELVTAVEHSLPVLVVCFNNHRLGMINSQEQRLGLAPFFTERPQTDFARVAEALGAEGLHVEEPAALNAAIHRGVKARRPFVLDVAVDPLETQATALQMERARV